MVSIDEFYEYFTQSILTDAESRGLLKPQAFFETVCEELLSIGDLSENYTYGEYIKKGIEVLGYDYDEERKVLTILNHHFFQTDAIQTLTANQIDTKFSRMNSFFVKSAEGMHLQMEETSEAYSVAYNICKYIRNEAIDRVRLMLLTDGRTTRSIKELTTTTILGIQVEYRIIDIEYLYKIYTSMEQAGDFEVNVDLPFLKVNNENDKYVSYLTVLNGDLLVKIYEAHGQKLFEQNVRTFLQFKGGVNRGLRNTIESSPEMFFAYNNGITATASDVIINKTGNIECIKNFQIVNGGQTTSAIYAASKTSKIDVTGVNVQMKLSVLKEANTQDDFISKVAEYANTQNKINNSDFFSNSPFHKDMKNYSTRIFAPANSGYQRRTHWYYERVRGEYLNNQAYLSKEKKGKFLLENPKNQLFDKTLLSKTENSWGQKPDIVSKGAQVSFKKFVEYINETLEIDDYAITESFFKDAVSRIILFRSVEKLVTKATWYDGGFRAQTVTYTISFLSYYLEKMDLTLNFKSIWENQSIPNSLYELLEMIAGRVYRKITNPPTGYANITQWTKNVGCWESVKKLSVKFENLDSTLFIDKSEKAYILKEDKKIKKIDVGIDKQIDVLNTNIDNWKKLEVYYLQNKSQLKLSAMQSDILSKMSQGKLPLPSEKQAVILHKLKETALKEGLILNG